MSQIKRRGIENNAVGGAQFRLDNSQALRARNAADLADVELLKLNAANELEVLSLPRAAAALPLPSHDKEFATIEYIKAVVAGKGDAKDAVNALADANVAMTGATAALAALTDAVAPFDGMRLALTGQTNAVENGVYSVAIAGANYTLTRSTDFVNGSVSSGAYFPVIAGTVYAGYEVILTTADTIVVGTTALTFAKYPSGLIYTAGDMLRRVGNDFSVDLAPLAGLESTSAGDAAGQLRVKADQATLEKDKSTRIDGATGAVVAMRSRKATFTLQAGDITNGYVDLAHVAGQDSVMLSVAGFGDQLEGEDYAVNYTGGTGGKTRVSLAGGLAVAGVSPLVVGDKVQVAYKAF